jgi:cytochrome c2
MARDRGRGIMVAAAVAACLCAGCVSGAPGAGRTSGAAATTSSVSSSGPSAAGGLSDGAKLVASKCTRCHSIDRVQAARKSREVWTATITKMQGHGLQVTDAEREAVITYLTVRDGGQ